MKLKTKLTGTKDEKQVTTDLAEIDKTIKAKEAELAALKSDITKYSGSTKTNGVCPIVEESCDRISRDAISKKVSQLTAKKNGIDSELAPLYNKQKALSARQKQILGLLGEAKRLNEIKKEEVQLSSYLKTNSIERNLLPLKRQLMELKNCVVLKPTKISLTNEKDLKKVQREYKRLNAELEKHRNKNNSTKGSLDGTLSEKESQRSKTLKNVSTVEREEQDRKTKEVGLEDKKRRLTQKQTNLSEIVSKLSKYKLLDKEIQDATRIKNKNKKDYTDYIATQKAAEGLTKTQASLKTKTDELTKLNASIDTITKRLDQLSKEFNKADYAALEETVNALVKEKTKKEEAFGACLRKITELTTEIKEMETERKKLEEFIVQKEKFEKIGKLIGIIRELLNRVGEPISQRYLLSISRAANLIYNDLADEKVELSWEKDYLIRIRNHEGVREFNQLSGGEQMTSALSIQLALAKELSDVGVAIFDEPTTNLDEVRRTAVAKAIVKIREEYGFGQIFVISHDETFSSITEQEIHLEKRNNTTQVIS